MVKHLRMSGVKGRMCNDNNIQELEALQLRLLRLVLSFSDLVPPSFNGGVKNFLLEPAYIEEKKTKKQLLTNWQN